MYLEQNSIGRDFNPVENRLKEASVVEIAGFFKKAVEKEHLKDPKLSPYALFKSIAAFSLPLKIHDEIRQKALEAMTSEDADTKLSGKDAFLFLSLRSILTAVDCIFIKEEDTDKDREEMFSSAIISVMEHASDLKGKNQISARVSGLAKAGILSYFLEKYDMSLDFKDHNPAREISLIREIETLRNTDGFTNKEMRDIALGLSKEAGVPVESFLNYLTDRRSWIEMEEIKDSAGNVYEKIEMETDMKKFVNSLIGRQNNPRSMRQIRTLELKCGLKDGVDRTNDEVGREFGIGGPAVRERLKPAFRKLKHSSRRKLLEGYL